MRSKFLLVSIAVSMFVVFGGIANAATFISDSFPYPNGRLSTATNSHWVQHSGGTFTPRVNIVSNMAELFQSGSEDVNKPAGQTMAAGDKWYYSAVLKVTDQRPDPNDPVRNEYFMHFFTGFDFRARLGLTDPVAADTTKFRFVIGSTSLGTSQTPWSADLSYGATYKIVVSWDFDSGVANLWVNPATEASAKVTDTVPGAAGIANETFAMRQDFDSGNPMNWKVSVDGIAYGNDFTSVHLNAMNGTNIPEPASMALALLGLVGLGSCRRRS